MPNTNHFELTLQTSPISFGYFYEHVVGKPKNDENGTIMNQTCPQTIIINEMKVLNTHITQCKQRNSKKLRIGNLRDSGKMMNECTNRRRSKKWNED